MMVQEPSINETLRIIIYNMIVSTAKVQDSAPSSVVIAKFRFPIKHLEIGHRQTVVDWKSFARYIFITNVLNHSSQISRPGIVVQVDESLLCKGKYGVGRILTNLDLWIVGGIDDTGAVFMELTVIRNRDALKEIIRRNVAPG
ncbi:hypothetical protein RF11_04153 [Thelohanellus kitauei]|uniref:ISXO2-like transposase domain-containing protein n=1 Tax=Thelohanellus kitauei TaxID=669202 RepID=A0A0C2NCJ0_THEKT|nr:hypothetical protein RF11_04153 [Thelohanellus kitauei]